MRPTKPLRDARQVGLKAFAIAASLITTSVLAEPPHASYIFPAGGQRGTTVNCRIGGMYLHDRCPLHWDEGHGIVAPAEVVRGDTFWLEGPIIPFPASARKEDYPKDYYGDLAIAEDATLDTRFWRVSSSQGVTEARPFVVGDLPEVVEEETAGTPLPTHVEMPVTVNGRIFPHEDVDVWRFRAKQSQEVTVWADTTRIASPLHARLLVTDSDGRRVAESNPADPSPRLRFPVRAGTVYDVQILDANFGGYQNYVYRLTISAGPWVDHVFPLGGKSGSKVSFQLAGQMVSKATLPLGPRADRVALGFEHQGQAKPVYVAADDLAETVEQEPNETPAEALRLQPPAVGNGRISEPGDVDTWTFEAAKGTRYEFDVQAYRLGASLDALLTIRDATGKQLAQADDIDASNPDARLLFTAPGDGQYFVTVEDRFGNRGGVNMGYRLAIRSPQPRCEVLLSTDTLTIERGATAKLTMKVLRQGGWDGDLRIFVDDLPQGLKAEPVVVSSKQNQATLAIEAAEKARVAVVRLAVRAEPMPTDEPMPEDEGDDAKREPRPAVPCDVYYLRPSDRSKSRQLTVGVAMPTPFSFEGDFSLTYASRGSTFTKTYRLERGGFEGPLEVRLADRQTRHLQGVVGQRSVVPAEADSFAYTVYLPPWMELGRTSRTVVMATGEVTDEEGRVHKVCYTEGTQNQQLIAIVSPAALRLEASQRTLEVQPKQQVDLPFKLLRSPSLDVAAVVELVVPGHMTGIEARPVQLSSGATEGRLQLQLGETPGPFNAPVILRATATTDAGPVIAELPLDLVPVANR